MGKQDGTWDWELTGKWCESIGTKAKKQAGLLALLENWLNLVQVKDRFQTPVGGRERRREETLQQARGGGGTSPEPGLLVSSL